MRLGTFEMAWVRSRGPEQWYNSRNGKNRLQPEERGQWDPCKGLDKNARAGKAMITS